MTKVQFSGKPVEDYINDTYGSIVDFLDANGMVTGHPDRDKAWGRISITIKRGLKSTEAADEFSLGVLRTHPMNVWRDWFDLELDVPSYGDIEEELMSGRFASRNEFWAFVEDTISEELPRKNGSRTRFAENFFPEAREYLNSLPLNAAPTMKEAA